MKGKQLTLQEVLNLEDGSKVWVEISEEYKDYSSYLPRFDGIFYKKGTYLSDSILPSQMLRFKEIRDCLSTGCIYEWIEELKIPDKIETPYYSQDIVESMANEIAMHRYPNKYEYDDKLIESIIKEFS